MITQVFIKFGGYRFAYFFWRSIMSGWAAVEIGGEPYSAWEYRGAFLKFGTVYDEFFCPFCNIRLAGRNVYAEGESKNSPHFAALWGAHVESCDGEPIVENAKGKKPVKNHYTERMILAPEAFTDRPPPRKVLKNTLPVNKTPPTEFDIRERRKEAGVLGRNVPKTYQLQSLVEARNFQIYELYALASKNKWTDEKRQSAIDDVLSCIPLGLKDDHSNYKDGFRAPNFVHFSNHRIYYSKSTVKFEDGLYVVSSEFIRKKTGVRHLFQVYIDTQNVLASSPRSHIALIKLLNEYSVNGQPVRWYIYGKADSTYNFLRVDVNNLDYVYIKPVYQKPDVASRE